MSAADQSRAFPAQQARRMKLNSAPGESNDSGHVGTAWLEADGEQTEVVTTLIKPEGMQ